MLTVAVPLRGAAASSGVRQAVFALTLRNGAHTFTSDPLILGVLADGSPLTGVVEFGYEYDDAEDTVTVCGTGYRSPDTLHIVASHAAGRSNHDDPMSTGRHQRSPEPELVWDGLREVAASANDALISALGSVPGLNVGVRRPPPASPTVDLFVVYRGGEFLELYSAGRAYRPSDRIVHIDSVYNKTLTLSPKSRFRNVIGSTRDPKVRSMPWLTLWDLYANAPKATRCSSWHFPAVATPGVQKQSSFACNQRLVGGHIVLGTNTPQRITPGTNATVMIIPICSRHNGKPTTIMKPVVNRVAILLDRYMQ